jgi:hypothetical protein
MKHKVSVEITHTTDNEINPETWEFMFRETDYDQELELTTKKRILADTVPEGCLQTILQDFISGSFKKTEMYNEYFKETK